MPKLILAGGGNAKQSKLVDEFFVNLLPKKRFLFLPQAISPKIWGYKKVYQWIRKPKAFQNIEIIMWKDLNNKQYKDLKNFDAIYIMGGNTFNLLYELRKSKFLKPLKKFIKSNKIVYGISAGAMILGKDITMATLGPEADKNKAGIEDLSGLNLLDRLNVYCHYSPNQDKELFNYIKKTKNKFIAITEKSGVFMNRKSMTVIGYEPVYLFNNKSKIKFKPNTKINIT